MTTIYFLFIDWMEEFQDILSEDRYKHISIVERHYNNDDTCHITITDIKVATYLQLVCLSKYDYNHYDNTRSINTSI